MGGSLIRKEAVLHNGSAEDERYDRSIKKGEK